jgi:hypothetical protein
LEPIELNGVAEHRELFPEINIQTSQLEAKNVTSSLDEKGLSVIREVVFKRVASDDG